MMEKKEKSEIVRTNCLDNVEDLLKVGRELKRFIVKNKLSTNIQGKDYAHVDAWKFAGSNFGLSAIPETPITKHEKGQYIRVAFINKTVKKRDGSTYQKEFVLFSGMVEDEQAYDITVKGKNISNEITKPYFAYECGCKIVRLSDGVTVSFGTGICTNLESAKSMFDEYAVNSMSQTRSIGKAYRNLIGYIMNEAGYESTPAEEMEEDHLKNQQPRTKKGAPGKPIMTSEQAKSAMLKINSGEIESIEVIEKHVTITEDQRNAFISVFNSKKK